MKFEFFFFFFCGEKIIVPSPSVIIEHLFPQTCLLNIVKYESVVFFFYLSKYTLKKQNKFETGQV